MGRVSSGTMTVVIFAILMGLGGAFVVRQQLQQPRLTPLSEVPVPPTSIVVPTAATVLNPGQTLSINEIALLPIAPEKYADSRYAGVQYMRSGEQISGRTLRRSLKKGDPFLPEDFYAAGSGPQIVERLPAGYRAVTVPIENVGAVQGFAGPGSMVDVLFRSRPEGDRPEVTLTLLERVEVLAVDTNVVPGQQVAITTGGTVTLAVTPQQAKILKVVESRGELSLTLRGDADVDVLPFDLGPSDPFLGRLEPNPNAAAVSLTNTTSGSSTVNTLISDTVERVTLDDLLGLPAKLPTKQVEIYLGPEKTVVQFERNSTDQLQLLQHGGRIRTPIAHEPVPSGTRLSGRPVPQPVSSHAARPTRPPASTIVTSNR